MQRDLPQIIQRSEEILDEKHEGYVKYVRNTFQTKKEKILPLIIVIPIIILFTIIGFYSVMTVDSSLFKQAVWIGPPIALEMQAFLMYLYFALQAIVVFYLGMIICSVVMMLFLIFSCINKLGSPEFPLTVEYRDLKIGVIHEIGSFVISLTIPALFLSAISSVLGFITIYFFANYNTGVAFLCIGPVIMIIISSLLYRNTLHIHHSIADTKYKMKKSLMDKVPTTFESDQIDFDQIYKIHALFNEVDKINDWPFNPSSYKKLVAVFFSSIFPIILSIVLSIYGIGF